MVRPNLQNSYQKRLCNHRLCLQIMTIRCSQMISVPIQAPSLTTALLKRPKLSHQAVLVIIRAISRHSQLALKHLSHLAIHKKISDRWMIHQETKGKLIRRHKSSLRKPITVDELKLYMLIVGERYLYWNIWNTQLSELYAFPAWLTKDTVRRHLSIFIVKLIGKNTRRSFSKSKNFLVFLKLF